MNNTNLAGASSAAAGARRSKLAPLLLALALQLALLFVAVFVVVLVPEFKSDPEFVAKKKVYLPQKELDHKAAVSEFQNAASSPMRMDRISTSAALPDALPALPDLPENTFNPIESNPAALQSESLLGASGLMGALEGLETASSSASLFGIEDSGQRILILFDNSVTVWNKARSVGVTTDAFVRELGNLVDGLNANTLFGLVPFARQVGTFRDYMISAGSRNKAVVKDWIVKNVRSNRKQTELPFDVDGIQGALTVAFQMEPDVIFVVADGDFQRNASENAGAGDVPWEDVERTMRRLTREFGIEPRLHFVGFQVEPEAADAIRRLTRRYDGEFREFTGK